MNIIKYLSNKNICPECKRQLKYDYKKHEIYCTNCGLLLLDNSLMTDELIDYALQFDKGF